jgi:hypothetical protein
MWTSPLFLRSSRVWKDLFFFFWEIISYLDESSIFDIVSHLDRSLGIISYLDESSIF